MRTLNDDIITIPNNKFLNEVTSGNYGALDMQGGDSVYAPGMDEDITARDLIQEAAPHQAVTSKSYLLGDGKRQHHYLTTPSAIQLTRKAYVVDTAYEKLFETDITLRVMKEFKKHNINPPKNLGGCSP